MSVGFEVRNDSGTYTITSDYKNLQLKQKGTASLSLSAAYDMGTVYRSTSISVTGCTLPFLAHRSSNLVGCSFSTVIVGGVFNFIFYSPTVSTSVDWYVFDLLPAAGGSGFGLQVFNSLGEITFDAANGPLRISGISQMPGGHAVTSNLSVAYPGGKTYAGIHSTSGYNTVSDGFPGNYDNREAITMTSWSGTTLTGRYDPFTAPRTAIFQDLSDAPPTNSWYIQQPAIIVVDVTGL